MLPEGQRWFDDNPTRTFEQRVRLAVTHYRATKELRFNTVYVCPGPNLPKQVDDITVRANPGLSPNYFHFTWEERKPRDGAIPLTLTVK